MQIAAGATVVAAFLGGAWVGRAVVKADWATEREQRAREQTEYISRNFVSRAVVEKQYQALAGRSSQILREVVHVKSEPLKCPPDADVRDVVLPGLADKLRQLRDASGLPTRPDVDAVQSGASTPADDRTRY